VVYAADVLKVFEWLWQGRVLADADALIAQESPEHRTRRLECRALFDAAEQLEAAGHPSNEALTVLHRRGVEVSQETTALPSWLPHAHSIVLARLEAPQRARSEALGRRLYRLSGVAMVALAIYALVSPAIERLTTKPELLTNRPFKLSSSFGACKPKEHSCAGVTTDIFFHTNHDNTPWIEYDLGESKSFSRLYVKNRQDSQADRAVPLLAESSDDEKTWKEIVRRDQVFSEWSIGFPTVTARYFRLRVDKPSWLHLEKVELK
jgi:hypothetical protein